MREILFRGKRKNDYEWLYKYNEWLYGFPYITRKNAVKINWYCSDFGSMRTDEVDPETVGQYTGLTDKNGTKIFEGDILKGFDYPYLNDKDFNYFAKVVWFDNCPAFGIYTFKNPQAKIRGISEGNTEFMEEWNPSQWEVIGNIHDNPELLREPMKPASKNVAQSGLAPATENFELLEG